jgi:hypothetical protein
MVGVGGEAQVTMQVSEAQRAVAAAMTTAATLNLSVEDAIVLHDSNRLVVRLLPCDVVARVAPMAYQASAELEVKIVQRLAETDSPLAVLDPRVDPCVYVRDSFVIAMWSYYEPAPSEELSSADYAHALGRLHAGMRQMNFGTPHFMDRVADTRQWVASHDVTPELTDADRALLVDTLGMLGRSIIKRGAVEQLLHGEPHPWNVLSTTHGPLFLDFENSCRGPVEYDLAWVPEAVSEHYPGADQDLVGACRGLMLAIVAAHRWRRDDQHPSGRPSGEEFLKALREGPPWRALDNL